MHKLIAKVIKELGHVFDVLSVKILENRKRIMALETRIKEMDNTMSYKLALINIGFMLFWYCILVIVGVF